jgi:hypothetical protein
MIAIGPSLSKAMWVAVEVRDPGAAISRLPAAWHAAFAVKGRDREMSGPGWPDMARLMHEPPWLMA